MTGRETIRAGAFGNVVFQNACENKPVAKAHGPVYVLLSKTGSLGIREIFVDYQQVWGNSGDKGRIKESPEDRRRSEVEE